MTADLDDEIADLYALEILVRTYPFDRQGPITKKWPPPIELALKRIASRRARRSAELAQATAALAAAAARSEKH